MTHSYWLDTKLIKGQKTLPKNGGVLVIGSGLAGVSSAYWLNKYGMDDITILDYEAEKSASFRNCGHVLYGTVESMKALIAIHGEKVANEIWGYSIDICHEVRDTVKRLKLDADYKQDGYLVIAIDDPEDLEIKGSIEELNKYGYQSSYVEQKKLEAMGFRNVRGARFESGSAQAHPVKFRNGIISECLKQGVKYHSDCKVIEVEEENEGVLVKTTQGDCHFDAVIIAANAYGPLLSHYFKNHSLVEPFRGQIITSKQLSWELPVTYPHSFDHGYEYALKSEDNRLIIGGWRNNTPAGEIGTYDISPNKDVEIGLQDFVERHYQIKEKIEWEYSWAGIMGTSKTGFPFIGPTDSPRIFCCAGFTGHGFSWAHGSGKLLAQIVTGEDIPEVSRFFNPRLY